MKSQDSAAAIYSPKIEFDDGDIYDDLDPAMKEELDRLDMSNQGCSIPFFLYTSFKFWAGVECQLTTRTLFLTFYCSFSSACSYVYGFPYF